jgi:uncharacterized protein YdiU (UPF0061 family)
MNISRELKEELSQLSKDVFGSRSRWIKLVEKGYDELETEEVEQEVPGKDGAPPTKQTVSKPKLRKGVPYYVRKRHTVESIKALMLDRKEKIKQFNELLAQMKKDQEKQAAEKKLIEKVQEEAAGGALA